MYGKWCIFSAEREVDSLGRCRYNDGHYRYVTEHTKQLPALMGTVIVQC